MTKKNKRKNDRIRFIISALCIKNFYFYEEEWQSILMKKENIYT